MKAQSICKLEYADERQIQPSEPEQLSRLSIFSRGLAALLLLGFVVLLGLHATVNAFASGDWLIPGSWFAVIVVGVMAYGPAKSTLRYEIPTVASVFYRPFLVGAVYARLSPETRQRLSEYELGGCRGRRRRSF